MGAGFRRGSLRDGYHIQGRQQALGGSHQGRARSCRGGARARAATACGSRGGAGRGGDAEVRGHTPCSEAADTFVVYVGDPEATCRRTREMASAEQHPDRVGPRRDGAARESFGWTKKLRARPLGGAATAQAVRGGDGGGGGAKIRSRNSNNSDAAIGGGSEQKSGDVISGVGRDGGRSEILPKQRKVGPGDREFPTPGSKADGGESSKVQDERPRDSGQCAPAAGTAMVEYRTEVAALQGTASLSSDKSGETTESTDDSGESGESCDVDTAAGPNPKANRRGSEPSNSDENSDFDKPLRTGAVSPAEAALTAGKCSLTVRAPSPPPAAGGSIHKPTAMQCTKAKATLRCPKCTVVGKMGLAGSAHLQRRMQCTSCRATTTGQPLQNLVARELKRVAWCQSEGIAPDGTPRREMPEAAVAPRRLSQPGPASPPAAATSSLEARFAALEDRLAEMGRELRKTEAARESGAQEVVALRVELRGERAARQKLEQSLAQFAIGETAGGRRTGERSYAVAVTGTVSSPRAPVSILRNASRVPSGDGFVEGSRSVRAEKGRENPAAGKSQKNSAGGKKDAENSTGEKPVPAEKMRGDTPVAAPAPKAGAKEARELAKLRELLAARRKAVRGSRGNPQNVAASSQLVGVYVRGFPQGAVGPVRRQMQRMLGDKGQGAVPNISLFGASMAEIVCRRDKVALLKKKLPELGLQLMNDDYVPYKGDGPGVREACQARWRKFSARGNPSEKNVPNWACRQWYSAQLNLLQASGPALHTPEPAADAAEGAGEN